MFTLTFTSKSHSMSNTINFLRRFDVKDPTLPLRDDTGSILECLCKDPHIFRNATDTKSLDDSVRKYWQRLITKCKEKRAELINERSSVTDTRVRKRKRRVPKDPLIGRRVSMSGDVWGLNPNLEYVGVITRQRRFRYKGKMTTVRNCVIVTLVSDCFTCICVGFHRDMMSSGTPV